MTTSVGTSLFATAAVLTALSAEAAAVFAGLGLVWEGLVAWRRGTR